MRPGIHYQINICGGDFRHVKHRFPERKEEPLVYRKNQRMFEGKTEVRPLSEQVFDNAERARAALEQTCGTDDAYALAAAVKDGWRDIWLVMAAYNE
jgi:hypothetical protein